MSDQTSNQFSADKVRKIVNNHLMEADQKVAEIKAMLSPPKRPTLADMDEKERAASQWMQADVPGLGERHVIAVPCDDSDDMAGLISADGLASVNGGIRWMHPENVTPRPDLPRLEWPGDTKVEDVPALPGDWQPAHHHRIGRVIVTNPTPNPGGHIYFVTSDDEDARGYQWGLCTPDELTCLDTRQGADTSDAVPPDTLAAMIAGMHTEYAVSLSDGTAVGLGWGTYDTALEDMNAWRQGGYDAHIVRRYVTGQEKIT